MAPYILLFYILLLYYYFILLYITIFVLEQLKRNIVRAKDNYNFS